MGFFDELKDKAEEFGDKAKEGFGAAKDKTEDVIDNVKDRFDGDDTVADQAKERSRLLDRNRVRCCRWHQRGSGQYRRISEISC